jgi:hypothetical protein
MNFTAFNVALLLSIAGLALLWAAWDNMRRRRRTIGIALAVIACLSVTAASFAAYALMGGDDPTQWFSPSAPCSAIGHC